MPVPHAKKRHHRVVLMLAVSDEVTVLFNLRKFQVFKTRYQVPMTHRNIMEHDDFTVDRAALSKIKQMIFDFKI